MSDDFYRRASALLYFVREAFRQNRRKFSKRECIAMNALLDLVESALSDRSFSIYEAMRRQDEQRFKRELEADAREREIELRKQFKLSRLTDNQGLREV